MDDEDFGACFCPLFSGRREEHRVWQCREARETTTTTSQEG